MIIFGNYTLQVNPNWKQLQLQEIYLECDTTLAPVDITLPEIASMGGFFNVKIYVSDFADASVNNITINAVNNDTIDVGTSITLDIKGVSAVIAITSPTQWICLESSVSKTSFAWELIGNVGTDPLVNFAGTKDTVDYVIKTNEIERMRVLATGEIGIGTATPTSALYLKSGDLKIDSGDLVFIKDVDGVVLKSPDNTLYRVTVANGGTLTVTAV